MEKIKKIISSKWTIVLLLIIMFILACFVNINTIWVADDYAFYNKVWTGQDKFSFNRVIEVTNNFYNTWTGRYVSTAINYALLYFPKVIFNILNSIVFVGLIYAIYKIIKKDEEHNSLLLLEIFAMIWLFVPRTGETMFWQIGSVIYMWTFCGIVLFSMPYCNLMKRKIKISHPIIFSLVLFITGIIVGNGFETNSLMFIFFLTIAMIAIFIRDKKLPVWSISGYLAIIIGFATNFFSPGNSVRMQSMQSAETFFDMILFGSGRLFFRGIIQTRIYILLIILIILYYIYIFQRKRKCITTKKMQIINILLFIILITVGALGIYCEGLDLNTYLQWFYENYKMFNKILLIFIIMSMIILVYSFIIRKTLFDKTEKSSNMVIGTYSFAALIGISSYIVTALAWPRSYMGMAIFLIIAIMYVFNRIEINKYVKYLIFAILITAVSISYVKAIIEIYDSKKWFAEVEEEILQEINNEQKYIIVQSKMFENSHNAASTEKWVIPAQLEDEDYVTEDKIHKDYEWINKEITNYYFKNNNAWNEGRRILAK